MAKFSLPANRQIPAIAPTGQALAALGEAVDAGWRVYWRIYLPHDPALAGLRERPELASIVAALEADMAAQRAGVGAAAVR